MFWFERPSDIISSFSIIPSPNDDLDEKLNACTRLILIIALVLAICGISWWGWFLLGSLLVIIAIWRMTPVDNYQPIKLDDENYEHIDTHTDHIEEPEIEEMHIPRVRKRNLYSTILVL